MLSFKLGVKALDTEYDLRSSLRTDESIRTQGSVGLSIKNATRRLRKSELIGFYSSVVQNARFSCLPLKFSRTDATLLRAPGLFLRAMLAVRKLGVTSLSWKNGCFSTPCRTDERRKMVMRKRAVGWDTFWLLAGNTWDLRHVMGIKLLDLGSRSRAKSHCGNNHCETNFSYCRKKNVDFSRMYLSSYVFRMYLAFFYVAVYI